MKIHDSHGGPGFKYPPRGFSEHCNFCQFKLRTKLSLKNSNPIAVYHCITANSSVTQR